MPLNTPTTSTIPVKDLPIPTRLNAVIMLAITVCQVGLLAGLTRVLPHVVDDPRLLLLVIPALVLFGVVGITTYQVMHEAEHGILANSERLNALGGFWMAALFGGPFTFLRACHLGHHARNRTEDECFEIIWPHQRWWPRVFLFYALFLGGFWLLVPLSGLVLAISPSTLRKRFVARSKAAAMVQGMPAHWHGRIQVEAIAVVALHVGAMASGLVSPLAWVLCYGALALIWSTQNYLGHAHDETFAVASGAFNLDVNPIYGAFLLNFHWHLAHHEHPQVPWVHLPRLDDPSRPHRPYGRAWVTFLRGPVPPPPTAATPTPSARPIPVRHAA